METPHWVLVEEACAAQRVFSSSFMVDMIAEFCLLREWLTLRSTSKLYRGSVACLQREKKYTQVGAVDCGDDQNSVTCLTVLSDEPIPYYGLPSLRRGRMLLTYGNKAFPLHRRDGPAMTIDDYDGPMVTARKWNAQFGQQIGDHEIAMRYVADDELAEHIVHAVVLF